jgi:acyl-CoA dehydrogenase
MIDYSAFEKAAGLNWYEVDPNLQALMDRLLDPSDRPWAEEHLQHIGALCGGPIAERAEIIDKNPPRLERYDRWGEEQTRIVHHPAATAAKRDCWESGISGWKLRREAGRRGRPFPMVLGTACNYLLSQADTGLTCATGMTVGVIGLVERFGTREVKEALLPHLTAERFEDAWDGAMFMTERTGGSDLGTLTTTAEERDGVWYLNGFKWFCSNIDAAAIATIARPKGMPDGIKGIALFVVPSRRRDGSPNGIRMRRLKDKLGTRTVPTGEVDFVDAEAFLLAGEEGSATDGRGINRMMEMVNESRLGIACMGLGEMRRAFLEAAIYAAHRDAFGRRLDALPMMRETLLRMAVDLDAAAALVLSAAAAMDQDPVLARILVPLAKFRAARQGIEHASTAVEVHGGNGYVEDWPIARLFREAQCHTIWEGTENIICLDVLRALRAEGTAQGILGRIAGASRGGHQVLDPVRNRLRDAAHQLETSLSELAGLDREGIEYRARSFATRLCDAVQTALLLEQAEWALAHKGSARSALVAALFATRRLARDEDAAVALEERVCRSLFRPVIGYGDVNAEAFAQMVS